MLCQKGDPLNIILLAQTGITTINVDSTTIYSTLNIPARVEQFPLIPSRVKLFPLSNKNPLELIIITNYYQLLSRVCIDLNLYI